MPVVSFDKIYGYDPQNNTITVYKEGEVGTIRSWFYRIGGIPKDLGIITSYLIEGRLEVTEPVLSKDNTHYDCRVISGYIEKDGEVIFEKELEKESI